LKSKKKITLKHYMKKLALVAVLAGLSLSLYGQGIVNMNTLQTGSYLRFFDTVGGIYPSDPTGTSLHVQLYWGTTASTVNTPVAGLAGFAAAPAGMILQSSGGGPRTILDSSSNPVITPIFVQLRAWSGALGSYEATASSGNGSLLVSKLDGAGASPIVAVTPSQSSVSAAAVIAWGGTSGSPLVANLVPVPEPSTIAMVGLGLLGLLFIRRRK
jgi:hypothetical protein